MAKTHDLKLIKLICAIKIIKYIFNLKYVEYQTRKLPFHEYLGSHILFRQSQGMHRVKCEPTLFIQTEKSLSSPPHPARRQPL